MIKWTDENCQLWIYLFKIGGVSDYVQNKMLINLYEKGDVDFIKMVASVDKTNPFMYRNPEILKMFIEGAKYAEGEDAPKGALIGWCMRHSCQRIDAKHLVPLI